MSGLGRKARRLLEAVDLIGRCAVGWPSRRALLECYADLGSAVGDTTEIDLRLRFGRPVSSCRMRRSDVFTLAEVAHEGQYEIVSALPDRPVIVDAGANVGISALWLLGRHPGARLHAFEPEAANFRLLERNLQAVERASAHRVALGSTDGEVTLRVAEHGAMHSTTDLSGGVRTERVGCTRLDSYLDDRDVDRVDLLKLDVEGAEIGVLDGLGARIHDVGVIVGEVHERLVDQGAFYRLLEREGFVIVRRVLFRDGDVEGVHGFEAIHQGP